jgi:hypothetical protein
VGRGGGREEGRRWTDRQRNEEEGKARKQIGRRLNEAVMEKIVLPVMYLSG